MSSYHAQWRREPENQPAEWSPDYVIAQQAPEVHALNGVLHLLSERDQSFARSLIEQAAQKPLSTREKGQLWWVRELTRKARAANTPGTPEAQTFAASAPAFVGKPMLFDNLVKLFAKAGARAFVVLRTAGGQDFRLSVAGERSANPGSINVTDTSGSFESRIWFGRITTTGSWSPSRKTDPKVQRAVEAALTEFDADPAKAAAEYGHAVGACCFCARLLTDERSVTVGYGPVCAERFGLPWGEVPGKLSCTEAHEVQAQIVSDADIPF